MDLFTTILVDPESTDMTILETVKEELNKDDNADDAKLGRYIRQASLAIQRHLNRNLARAEVTDSFRMNGNSWSGLSSNPSPLLLSHYPLVDINSVVVDGAPLDESEFEIDDASGRIWRVTSEGTRISWGSKVDISYVGGYEMLTNLPEDLEQACIMLVVGNWFRSGRDPLVRQESIPGVADFSYWVGGIGDNGALPPDVLALIEPYRYIAV